MLKIGSKIKTLRTRRQLTLNDLAKKTGLSISFFSQLERGSLSPSMNSLEKIAYALDADVKDFFEAEEKPEIIFIKKNSRNKVITEEKKIYVETLANSICSVKMQPKVFTFGVLAELLEDSICGANETFAMVLKGRLEFCWGSEKLTLAEGDSIHFDSTMKLYRIINVGQKEGKLLWMSFVHR